MQNSGRTLPHDAAVRAVCGRDEAAARVPGFHHELRPEWRRARLNAMGILQGKRTRYIYGAATTSLK